MKRFLVALALLTTAATSVSAAKLSSSSDDALFSVPVQSRIMLTNSRNNPTKVSVTDMGKTLVCSPGRKSKYSILILTYRMLVLLGPDPELYCLHGLVINRRNYEQ